MNYKLNIADRDEDDAFRARLAPLASEVLPRQSSREPSRPDPSRPEVAHPHGRRRLIAAAGIAAAVVALTGAWLYFEFPRLTWQDNAHAAARIDGPADRLPPQSALASAETKEKFGIQDNARAALRDAPVSTQSLSSISSAPGATEDMVVLLMRRGNTAIADGDIIAARMLYERAAALGSAAAATSVGKTYDVEFLLHAGARGIPADQPSAIAWFRKAAALGDLEARAQLARIESQSRP